MKRDAPLGGKPAAARDARSLREQLSKAVGDALRAVRSVPKTAAPSKQRLTDVLWHDRTQRASAELAQRTEPDRRDRAPGESGPAPRGLYDSSAGTEPSAPSQNAAPAVARGEPSEPAVEVVPDGEVEAWFAAALEEPPVQSFAAQAAAIVDAEAAADFSDAVEVAAAQAERARADLNADFDSLLSEITHPVAPSTPAPPLESGADLDEQQGVVATVENVVAAAEPATDLVSPAPMPSASVAPSTEAAPGRATPAPKAAAPAPAALARPKALPPDDDEPVDEEPICTRSMARLLAGQGHRQRALRIYDVLLKANAEDASLREEAEALRQAGSQA